MISSFFISLASGCSGISLKNLIILHIYILHLYILGIYILHIYILHIYILCIYTLHLYILGIYVLHLYILCIYVLHLYFHLQVLLWIGPPNGLHRQSHGHFQHGRCFWHLPARCSLNNRCVCKSLCKSFKIN